MQAPCGGLQASDVVNDVRLQAQDLWEVNLWKVKADGSVVEADVSGNASSRWTPHRAHHQWRHHGAIAGERFPILIELVMDGPWA
jgi:hypothetical protein